MCNCIYNTEVRDRCLPNRNMQNFKDCEMRNNTALWLFDNNWSYAKAIHRDGYKTYKQQAVILRKFNDKVLKLLSLVYKEDIISDYINQIYERDLDQCIQEIWGERPKIRTRERVLEYLKTNRFCGTIKQMVKFTNKKEHTIESLMEEVWDNNEDLFEDRSEDSDAEDEDEDKD